MVLPTTPFVKIISGVLNRLTTCNWLTSSLPKLSLRTPGSYIPKISPLLLFLEMATPGEKEKIEAVIR